MSRQGLWWRVVALLRFGLLVPFICPAVAQSPDPFTETSDGSSFYQFAIDEDRLAGVPDQSGLNHPLGPADRIFVKDHHFYAVGPDGVPDTGDDVRVRLFGASLSFGANFPAEQDAVAYAKRLRKLGFNAVRLHHMDYHLSDDPDAPPQGVLTTGPYPTFNPVAIRRLRSFIGALADQGIYVDLNLHVSYRFRPAIDGLPPLDHGDRVPDGTIPIHVYYAPLIEKQKRYATGLIQALGLHDNPALALVEINNESSLLDAWQSDIWHSENWLAAIPPAYAVELQRQWHDWILRRYGTLAAACRAWDRCSDPDVSSLPRTTLFGGDADGQTLGQRVADRVGRAMRRLGWSVSGAEAEGPQGRYNRDFLTFLMETDRAYFNQMKATVRSVTRGRVPVAGTQMGYGGILNFDSQAGMDYIDNHIYIGHPIYAGSNSWQSMDWRVPDISTSGEGIDRILALSLRRDSRKPFVVSEFNQPFPSPRNGEILPLMSAVAALQDWDGLFFYDYNSDQQLKSAPSSFSLSGNWGQYALTGQSARIFRKALIPALPTRILLPLTESKRYALAMQGNIDMQTLESSLRADYGVGIGVAWADQLADEVLPDQVGKVARPELTELADAATPDGSVRHDGRAQRVVLDAPGVWGVFGGLGPGVVVRGASFGLRSSAAMPQSVQLLVTPLDGLDMQRSSHFLVSLGSFTTGTQPGSVPVRPKQIIPYPGKAGWLTLEPDPGAKGPSGGRDTQPPAWMARTDIELEIPYPVDDVAVYALDGAGQRRVRLPVDAMSPEGDGARTWVRLQGSAQFASPWYEIVIS